VNNLLKLKAEITGGYRIESPCERTRVRFGIVRSALLIQSGSASDTSKKQTKKNVLTRAIKSVIINIVI